MKMIWSLTTELWHILSVYIICPCDLDLRPMFPKIWSHDPEGVLNICPYLEVYRSFRFWNMRPQISDLVVPLLSNRRCHGNHSVSHSFGVLLMLAPKYELHWTTQYWVIAIFTGYVTLRYVVTLTVDLLTLESCHVMPLGRSIRVPSLNWIWLTVPELGRLQFSIDRQLKVPIFTFFCG